MTGSLSQDGKDGGGTLGMRDTVQGLRKPSITR